MGNDGSAGAKALAARAVRGARSDPRRVAPSPGMPGAAIEARVVREIASLIGIAERLNAWSQLPAPDREGAYFS